MRHSTNGIGTSEQGMLLVRQTLAMPPSILLNTERWSRDWCRILNFTPAALETRLSNAGWSFFVLANPIQTSVYGFDNGDFVYTAIARALRLMAQAELNCLQIEHVTRDTYLGAPRLKLEASRRHIQASSTLAWPTGASVQSAGNERRGNEL